MADFKQAVEWMKEGKKVQTISLDFIYYYIYNNEIYCWDIESNMKHHSQELRLEFEIEATDWEIYKHTDTLSDKIIVGLGQNGDPRTFVNGLYAEDVKSFIKQLKEKLRQDTNQDGIVVHAREWYDFIGELAGPKLI